jgi:hypothetical protein
MTDIKRIGLLLQKPKDERCLRKLNLLILKIIRNTVEPGYNDIGLYQHLTYRVRFPVVPINPSLLTITLYSSVITTLVYNDTKYSVPFVTL